MAKFHPNVNVECKCDPRFTCGYCLRNMKPWFYTLPDGSAIAEIPTQVSKVESKGEEDDNG